MLSEMNIELPTYRRRGIIVILGPDKTVWRQVKTDDFSEDQICHVAQTVVGAARSDTAEYRNALKAFQLPKRRWTYHAAECIFRRDGGSPNRHRVQIGAGVLHRSGN